VTEEKKRVNRVAARLLAKGFSDKAADEPEKTEKGGKNKVCGAGALSPLP